MSDTAAPAWGTIQPGDIITACPWAGGYELAAQEGVVLGAYDGQDGEFVTVWFRGLGQCTQDEAGAAVQPVLRVKVQAVRGNVTTVWGAQRRERLARQLQNERITGAHELYQVLVAQWRQETGR